MKGPKVETEPKWMIQSRTVWAALLILIPAILPVFGASFGTEEGALFSDFFDRALQIVAAGLAIYGRFSAKQPLSVSKP
ncbi:MAG: hypothetical protein AAGF15_02160 [Pseudomonadota bacterium]